MFVIVSVLTLTEAELRAVLNHSFSDELRVDMNPSSPSDPKYNSASPGLSEQATWRHVTLLRLPWLAISLLNTAGAGSIKMACQPLLINGREFESETPSLAPTSMIQSETSYFNTKV